MPRTAFLTLAVVSLIGCGTDPVPTLGSADAVADAIAETTSDGTSAPDVATAPDAAPDATAVEDVALPSDADAAVGPDSIPDASADASVSDVIEDGTGPDVPQDTSNTATTGSVTICLNPAGSGYPNPSYDNLVANGTWAGPWDGWGVVLEGPDASGRYCGTVSGLEPGTYEYVHAATGPADSFSGWGQSGNAPIGSACDINPTDDFGNFGFTITAGQHTDTCHRWDGCDCQAGPVEPYTCSLSPGRPSPVTIDGYQFLIDGVPTHLKGVAWSPIPVGQGPGSGGADWAGTVAQDAALMQAAGINAVRTYGPITDVSVLDTLLSHGIYVLMTVYYGYDETAQTAVDTLCQVKSHPAIIGWQVGNEWNYNNLGQNVTFDQAVATVGEVVAALKQNDSSRPVATVYGNLPPAGVQASLSNVDFWGLNIYSGISFYNLFNDWAALSNKPMFLAEYGADAYDGQAGAVDEATQATYVSALTQEIHANASVDGSGVCMGGMVFEFNDEWWKYSGGNWSEHDTAASWTNGAYPDPEIQEEWWGIVSIDRTPRQAYDAYSALTPPSAP